MDTCVRGKGRGRSDISCHPDSDSCLCYRPRCLVLCTNCGYQVQGRVRHKCPIHPQTVFLIDLTQCPRNDCKAYESLLCEFEQEGKHT